MQTSLSKFFENCNHGIPERGGYVRRDEVIPRRFGSNYYRIIIQSGFRFGEVLKDLRTRFLKLLGKLFESLIANIFHTV